MTNQSKLRLIALAGVLGALFAKVASNKQPTPAVVAPTAATTTTAAPTDEGRVIPNDCPRGNGKPYFVQVRHAEDSRDATQLDFAVSYRLADGTEKSWEAKAEGKGVSNSFENVLSVDAVTLRGATVRAFRELPQFDGPACEIVIASL